MNTGLDNVTVALLLLAGAILFAVLMAGIVPMIADLKHMLKYYNLEIRRTKGADRKSWLRARRRLILSLFFPFINRK